MSTAAKKIPIWSWRQAIAESNVPTLTKTLCWALALDLNDCGKYTVMSVEELVRITGMSERSISTHAQKAQAAGLITIERMRGPLGQVVGTKYYPHFPENVELDRTPAKSLDASPAGRENKSLNASPARLDAPPAGNIKKDSSPITLPLQSKGRGKLNSKAGNLISKNTTTRPETATPVKAKRGRPPKQRELPVDADAESAAVMAERALDEEGIALFNEAALKVGVRPVVALTSARRRDLRQMRTDLGAKGVDWRLVFTNLGKSTFPTKSGFVLNDFDHVMKYYVQLVEGSFCETTIAAPPKLSEADKQKAIWRSRIAMWIDKRRPEWPKGWEPLCNAPPEIKAEFPREFLNS